MTPITDRPFCTAGYYSIIQTDSVACAISVISVNRAAIVYSAHCIITFSSP